ncbi:N-formylglutamate amidohydrolase [Aquincola tertiaricarbonis]|uniref:N-formylglutamate amidohydrolase n=1 Tax=Aquincola tertiaricarbonis TaxID=391953 RepID=A0ABY4S725_AQUTE|nr:N-formylglutamate amidohydrolase [Aquincola tertiaricarbonis]URI07100.1 N-formylglutamate amidohydrolase [Aquincola tertiaricarbonis]
MTPTPDTRVQPHAATPFEPFTLHQPTADAVPLVADSPHSGLKYPADFGYALPFEELRAGEDTDVDVLWQALPTVGATLLAAEFPRSYIDPNRDPADLDAALLDAPWPQELQPSEKTRLGIGLIWRDAGHDGRQPIYDRRLSVAEVQARITQYHAPYQRTLLQQIEQAYQQHGAVWHLNLHSMPANSYEGLQIQTDKPLADVVLGNHDGRTCSEEFIQLVAEAMRRRGLSVAFNDPFKGVALIARIGRPAERRHSLQIELHRGLYMNEATRERSANFGALQQALAGVAAELAAYVRQQTRG